MERLRLRLTNWNLLLFSNVHYGAEFIRLEEALEFLFQGEIPREVNWTVLEFAQPCNSILILPKEVSYHGILQPEIPLAPIQEIINHSEEVDLPPPSYLDARIPKEVSLKIILRV